jgi:predicted secreted protein
MVGRHWLIFSPKNQLYMHFEVLFLLCMLAAGCSSSPRSGDDVVKVKSGETFEIKLESQIATGYRWSLADSLDARYLELVDKVYKESDTDVDGSMDTEIWTFKGLTPGKTAIHLLYNPAWKQEKAPDAKTRTVKVEIY